MIRRITRILSVLLPAVLMAGCAADMPDPSPASDECKIVLHLDLKDAMGDLVTRAAYDVDKNPIPPGELIQSLRVIIVSGSGNVEHHRHYTLSGVDEFTSEVFKVKGQDTKKVYFIANDDRLTLTSNGVNVSATEYFSKFTPGTRIDDGEFTALTVPYAPHSADWNSADRMIPMAAVASSYVPAKTDENPQPITADMHRAATKFSFRVTNDSPEPITLDAVHIGFMADKEYLFPNYTTYGTAPDGTPDPVTYNVPGDTKLSDFTQTYTGVTVAAKGGFIALPSIYFTEGQRFSDKRVYWTTLSVNGVELEKKDLKWRYPEESEATRDLKSLPRNSHIVIEARIKDKHTLNLTACVEPYASRELFPYFGLERKDDGSLIYRDPDGWLVSGEGYFDTPRNFEYIDARGNIIPEANIERDEKGHVVKIRDFEGYNLSKNGYPLDDTGVEGYRDDGDDGNGLNSRVRNHDGYVMDKDGHLIDAEGSPATRREEDVIDKDGNVVTDEDGNVVKKIVVRSHDGYILGYEGQLVDAEGNPCERRNGFVVRIFDGKVIDKNGKPIE